MSSLPNGIFHETVRILILIQLTRLLHCYPAKSWLLIAICCCNCHLLLGLLHAQICSLPQLIALCYLSVLLSLPNYQQVWGCLAPQLPHYRGKWAWIILVPLVINAAQTICYYPNMPWLEVPRHGPEVIMLLPKVVDQSSLWNILLFFIERNGNLLEMAQLKSSWLALQWTMPMESFLRANLLALLSSFSLCIRSILLFFIKRNGNLLEMVQLQNSCFALTIDNIKVKIQVAPSATLMTPQSHVNWRGVGQDSGGDIDINVSTLSIDTTAENQQKT